MFIRVLVADIYLGQWQVFISVSVTGVLCWLQGQLLCVASLLCVGGTCSPLGVGGSVHLSLCQWQAFTSVRWWQVFISLCVAGRRLHLLVARRLVVGVYLCVGVTRMFTSIGAVGRKCLPLHLLPTSSFVDGR